MRKWVDFEAAGMTLRGYEDAPLPIDKMAQLVLSSDVHEISSITVGFDPPISYKVVATSETHIGSPGSTTLYNGPDAVPFLVEMLDWQGKPFDLTVYATTTTAALEIARQIKPVGSSVKLYVLPTKIVQHALRPGQDSHPVYGPHATR